MPALPTVILMTSNGVGMGHLSRQLTIALSGTQRFRAIIFSLSKALPRVTQAEADGDLPEAAGRGLEYEYCPSRESGWLPPGGWARELRRRYPSYRWHPYLRDRLSALITETSARAVVFDGVYPYAGMLAAREEFAHVPFVWVRRAMWRPGAPAKQLGLADRFDAVIEPGDFAGAADTGPTTTQAPTHRIAPISLTDVLTPTSTAGAKAALGLPPDRPTLLLTPGSGALGSVEATAKTVTDVVASLAPGWTIAVTKPAIAHHLIGADESVVVLDDVYPLARHLAAFDAAVSAAGYNSVHELLSAGVPTLLVPSDNHATDNQRARAEGVTGRGLALVTTDSLSGNSAGDSAGDSARAGAGSGAGSLASGVEQLLDSGVRARLREACAALEPADGGREAVRHIADLVSDASPAPRARFSAPRRPLPDARTPAVPGSATEIITTEHPSSQLVRGSQPVEHLLAGSSAQYRTDRERITGWLYRTR